MQNRFRYLNTGESCAYYNMALDEALFLNSISSDQPILRLYTWSSPSITIGFFQDAEKTINLQYCKENRIQIVRRLTGGRGVLHDKELTYSVIIPPSSKLFKVKKEELYKIISKALISGLEKIGVKGQLTKPKYKSKNYIDKAKCFSSISLYEITIDGKKLVGSAQKRTENGVIQQGSILLDLDPLLNNKVFITQNNDHSFDDNRIITIAKILGHKPEISILKDSIVSGFEKIFNLELIQSKPTNEELCLAEKLLKEKYSKDDWNYQRKI
jgi:lipoyl(octanoyl) transferase